MNTDKIGLRCFVSGRVQGVFFRAATTKKARALKITGWIRNRKDGRVETLLCGNKEKVEELYAWLHKGPSAARVDHVIAHPVDWEEFNDFDTQPDA